MWYIILETSEVGGSESAFRLAPPNREIVSFRACVRRAVFGCTGESGVKLSRVSLFPFPFLSREVFPFPLWDWVIPFSLVRSGESRVQGKSKWIQSETKWVRVSRSGSKWTQVSPSEPRWVQVSPNESKWMPMSPSESKWIQERPSKSKWVQMIPSESQWEQVNFPPSPQSSYPAWAGLMDSIGIIISIIIICICMCICAHSGGPVGMSLNLVLW